MRNFDSRLDNLTKDVKKGLLFYRLWLLQAVALVVVTIMIPGKLFFNYLGGILLLMQAALIIEAWIKISLDVTSTILERDAEILEKNLKPKSPDNEIHSSDSAYDRLGSDEDLRNNDGTFNPIRNMGYNGHN